MIEEMNPLSRELVDALLTDHLVHSKNQLVAIETSNRINALGRKTHKGGFGALSIQIPRDKAGTFEPQLITKHQTRRSDFDDKILLLCARGTTVRKFQEHQQEMCGAEVSPIFISSVTDVVMDEVKAWQSHLLNALYPIVHMDCIHVTVQGKGADWLKPCTWPLASTWRV